MSSKLLLNSESSVKLDQISQDFSLSGLKQTKNGHCTTSVGKLLWHLTLLMVTKVFWYPVQTFLFSLPLCSRSTTNFLEYFPKISFPFIKRVCCWLLHKEIRDITGKKKKKKNLEFSIHLNLFEEFKRDLIILVRTTNSICLSYGQRYTHNAFRMEYIQICRQP